MKSRSAMPLFLGLSLLVASLVFAVSLPSEAASRSDGWAPKLLLCACVSTFLGGMLALMISVVIAFRKNPEGE